GADRYRPSPAGVRGGGGGTVGAGWSPIGSDLFARRCSGNNLRLCAMGRMTYGFIAIIRPIRVSPCPSERPMDSEGVH
ncbi:MAG: hypothetical protein ACUVSH_06515, partial [Anaerolineae bacterium]